MNQLLSEWESRHEQVWSKEAHSLITLTKALSMRQSKEKAVEMQIELRDAWLQAVIRSQALVKDADLAIDQLRGEDDSVAKKVASKEKGFACSRIDLEGQGYPWGWEAETSPSVVITRVRSSIPGGFSD